MDFELPFDRLIIQMCPFLRNIRESTNFCFASTSSFPAPVKGSQGPIFEDGPNFALAFKLFHGQNGMVPLSGQTGFVGRDFESSESNSEPTSVKFHPLAASAATISLSALGTSGPFGFDAFMSKRIKMNQPERRQHHSQKASSSFLGIDCYLVGQAWVCSLGVPLFNPCFILPSASFSDPGFFMHQPGCEEEMSSHLGMLGSLVFPDPTCGRSPCSSTVVEP